MTASGNHFNDFLENQPTIDSAFLCKPTWWNSTVSPFPLVPILFGGTAFPRNIWGHGVPRRRHHC